MHVGSDGTPEALERPSTLRLQIEPRRVLHRVLWGAQALALLVTLVLPMLAIARLRWRLLGAGISRGEILASALACSAMVVALPLLAFGLHVTLYRYVGDVRLMFMLIAIACTFGSVCGWLGHVGLWRRASAAR
jgi:hypothetical protein